MHSSTWTLRSPPLCRLCKKLKAESTPLGWPSIFYLRPCGQDWRYRAKTKSRVYTAVVRTILLYGYEIKPLRVEDRKRLEVFDNDCLRRIERCHRRDRVPCAVLRQSLQFPTLPASSVAAPSSLVRSRCPLSTWRIHARADQPRCSPDLAQANWRTT